MTEVSQLIWSGQTWNEGTALVDAAARPGLDFAVVDGHAKGTAAALDRELDRNSKTLENAGHWAYRPVFWTANRFSAWTGWMCSVGVLIN